MQTLDQKVQAIADKINYGVKSYDDLLDIIRLAMKEQDRDTRHACAEAIISDDPFGLWDGNSGKEIASHYHNVVMNCRDGIGGAE